MSTASVCASLLVIFVSVPILALPWLLSHLRRLAQILADTGSFAGRRLSCLLRRDDRWSRGGIHHRSFGTEGPSLGKVIGLIPAHHRSRLLGSRTMGGPSV